MANDPTTGASDTSGEFAAAAYQQTAIVAGAMASSLVMYVLVVEVLTRSAAGVEAPAYLGALRVALFVAAGVVIFTATIVKGVMLRNAPADPVVRLTRLRRANLTALALSEVPVVCGLILAVLGRARADFYMLLAISAYMMVRHFPRRGAWDDYLRTGGGAR